jgi:hypothetical protein
MTKVEIIELYIRDLESKVGVSPARNNRINMLKDELKQALTIPVVIVPFVCRDCDKSTNEYRDNLCEPCHKWHTDS